MTVLSRAILLLLLLMPIVELAAQPGGGPPPDPGRPVPIEGLGFLLAAGTYLGVKRILGNRKKNLNN